MPQRFKKNIIFIFSLVFFVKCFTHDPSNGVAFFVTARVTAQRLHTPTTRQAQKQRVPGIFPRLEDGYSLEWRMDIPSIGGWIFPRLEDGYSLDWRMDNLGELLVNRVAAPEFY